MSASFLSRSGSSRRHRLNRARIYAFAALLIGESAGCGKNYTGPSSPVLTLSAVHPSSGPAGAVTSIEIEGAAFQPATILTIGGVVTEVKFITSSLITAIAPAHEAGAVDVVVTNSDGRTSTLTGGFRYVPPPGLAVTAITPATGSTEGGTRLLLNGTSFQKGLVASIDGVAQQTFFANSTFATLLTTPHAAGPVDIVITNTDGTTTRVGGRYTFALPQSFDFNGTWAVYLGTSETPEFRFTIKNDALISITCGSSTPIAILAPPAVVNGEFSFTDRSAVCPGGLSRRGKRGARLTFPAAGPEHGTPRSRGIELRG